MEEKKIILSPSLLSCDFYSAGKQLEALTECGVDHLHLDVMDGIFVPNISFGQVVIKSLRKACGMFFDAHLMIAQPERYIDDFINAGCDNITIHIEAATKIAETLEYIKSKSCAASLSLKPKTDPEIILPYLHLCDTVLVMTVEPGFGGQKFMQDMLPKIRYLDAEIKKRGLRTIIQADGGIDETTARAVYEAGARNLVAGNSIFGKNDLAAAVDSIYKSINI